MGPSQLCSAKNRSFGGFPFLCLYSWADTSRHHGRQTLNSPLGRPTSLPPFPDGTSLSETARQGHLSGFLSMVSNVLQCTCYHSSIALSILAFHLVFYSPSPLPFFLIFPTHCHLFYKDQVKGPFAPQKDLVVLSSSFPMKARIGESHYTSSDPRAGHEPIDVHPS